MFVGAATPVPGPNPGLNQHSLNTGSPTFDTLACGQTRSNCRRWDTTNNPIHGSGQDAVLKLQTFTRPLRDRWRSTDATDRTRRMESLNPYRSPPCSVNSCASGLDVYRRYILRHFVCFFTTYLTCTFAFYCAFAGLDETVAAFTGQFRVWSMTLKIGLGLWFVHACVAMLNANIFRAGPVFTSLVGAIAFMACILCQQLIQDYGPNSLAVPMSWTPEYILLSFYFVVSVTAVTPLVCLNRNPISSE
ncbi:hypothetical protein Pla100_63190 [Neorhodopirellula pilleata]|uniref:Uncharacterized protein n=1 Tax=Neorhodopirellula pilleata TaxID=2714738 RepID=A0A5C5YQJ8_9BACT|nr:hypothetical protein Pla100_63190 [Neorhodopirellula pilleata]